MTATPTGGYIESGSPQTGEEYNDIPVNAGGGEEIKIRNAPPKGTIYGKKVSYLLIFLGAAVVTVLLLGKLMSQSKPAPVQPVQESAQMPVNQDMTPEELKKIPSSHGNNPATAELGSQAGQNLASQYQLGQQFQLNQAGQTSGVRQNESQNSGAACHQTSVGYEQYPYRQTASYKGGNQSTGTYNNIPKPPVLQPLDTNTVGYQSVPQNGQTLEEREMELVRKSQLRFGNSMTSTNSTNGSVTQRTNNEILNNLDQMVAQYSKNNPLGITGSGSSVENVANSTGETKDQNMQDEKRGFASQKSSNAFYALATVTQPVSPYEVKAGTTIPVVLVTGINSDLPGNMIAQVRENVYDSVSGRYLLIPQGTKVIGTYDSKVSYAQNRVLVVWNRIIFPNGDSLDLGGISGTDQSGHAGLRDKVNNHYGKLFMGVLFTSVLGAAAEVANNNSSSNSTYGALAAQGAAQSLQQVGEKLVEKNLNVQPTLEIRPGYRFNLFVDKDFILKPYLR